MWQVEEEDSPLDDDTLPETTELVNCAQKLDMATVVQEINSHESDSDSGCVSSSSSSSSGMF